MAFPALWGRFDIQKLGHFVHFAFQTTSPTPPPYVLPIDGFSYFFTGVVPEILGG
jgi:hypothetical protein